MVLQVNFTQNLRVQLIPSIRILLGVKKDSKEAISNLDSISYKSIY